MQNRFEWHLRVRYQETDQQGIVYHSRYLEYFDIAMTEFFRDLGWDYRDLISAGCDPSLAATSLTFHGPAHFDETVTVQVEPVRVGNSSFALVFMLHRGGAPLVSGETTYVNIDSAKGKSRTLPDLVRQRLTARIEVNSE